MGKGIDKVRIRDLEEQNKLLLEAFNAAFIYIHSSQDTGIDSQNRYAEWIKARDKIRGLNAYKL